MLREMQNNVWNFERIWKNRNSLSIQNKTSVTFATREKLNFLDTSASTVQNDVILSYFPEIDGELKLKSIKKSVMKKGWTLYEYKILSTVTSLENYRYLRQWVDTGYFDFIDR